MTNKSVITCIYVNKKAASGYSDMWSNLSMITYDPVHTNHLHNIFTTSAQRLRRWSSIVHMLCKCFVFTGEYEHRIRKYLSFCYAGHSVIQRSGSHRGRIQYLKKGGAWAVGRGSCALSQDYFGIFSQICA